jgi:hypothetical protein
MAQLFASNDKKKSDSKWLSLATASILGQPPSVREMELRLESKIDKVTTDLKVDLIKWRVEFLR